MPGIVMARVREGISMPDISTNTHNKRRLNFVCGSEMFADELQYGSSVILMYTYFIIIIILNSTT